MGAEVACNLCGADDYAVLFAAGEAQIARIVRCRGCGLMYANPRGRDPDHVMIEKWDPAWNLATTDTMRLDKQLGQVHDYASTRRLLAALYPQRGRLVEVGSGLGYLLRYFKDDGWDVLGVEPFVEGCRHAHASLGVDAVAATLENAALADASVDVLLMVHVIEHVPDPLRTLREVWRVLRPGGHAVIETPRYDTLMFRLLGRRERSLSCDGHIYFFTSDTLRRMTQKAGFDLARRDRVGRTLTLERLLWNLQVVGRARIPEGALAALKRVLPLERVRLHLNLRDMERVVLRKPGATPT